MTVRAAQYRWLRAFPWLWLVLAIPAVPMILGHALGGADAADLLHPSGEMSVRMMIVAMVAGPLGRLFGTRFRALRWLLARRRAFGVAAFGYALLHLVFYIFDMQTLKAMLDEIGAPGIWTGWLALVLMLPPAITSNDKAMRALKAGWKKVQWLVFPTALFTVIHWGLLFYEWGPALVHIAPVVLLHVALFVKSSLRKLRMSA